MSDPQTFRRNQCEWALWRTMRHLGAALQAPSRFRTRIKRLLEIDRAGKINPNHRAFSTDQPTGKGNEAQFTAFDVFCVGVALDLQNLGMNQSEAVFLVSHVREPDLVAAFGQIQDGPPRHLRDLLNPNDHPDMPTYLNARGITIVDVSVYLAIQKVELRELLPAPTQAKLPDDMPVDLAPTVCWGSDELATHLGGLRLSTRSALVVELGFLGSALPAFLAQAPTTHRGRP